MANAASDSAEDGSSDDSIASLPIGRETKREIVWMKERGKSIPRGKVMTQLNRDGRAKEVSFRRSMNAKEMSDIIRKTFKGLRHADFNM